MNTVRLVNSFTRKLREGKRCCVAWNQSGASYNSELFARAGFDAVILDLEHGPFSLETTVQHCQAVSAYPTTPFARISHHGKDLIKRVLDLGIYGLMIPQIKNVSEAKEVVQSCLYPPAGQRGAAKSCRAAGFGMDAESYFKNAKEDMFIMLMIETVEAVEHLDEIIKVDGVDGFFIGPLDLASSMGYLDSPNSPTVLREIEYIEKKLFASDKYVGTIADSNSMIEKFNLGYNFLTVLSDVLELSRASGEIIEKFLNLEDKF